MTDSVDRLDGLTVRPLRPSDAEAVYELTAAAELTDIGHRMIELEDVRSDWQRPSFDLENQSAGFFAADVMVAYGEVHRQRLEGYVHPDHRGRGYGTALFGWALDTARRLDYPRLGQTVPASNADAIALLTRHGATLLYSSWILELPAGATIAETELSDEYRLRDFDEDRDADVLFQTMEDAFAEWPDRPPSTIEDWRSSILGRSTFEPWQLLTVVHVSGDGEEIVGGAKVSVYDDESWIDQIAVRRDHRGHGLGRALLVAAFAAGREHGGRVARLNTDSRTGALGLYEHVGMSVVETYEHYALELASAS